MFEKAVCQPNCRKKEKERKKRKKMHHIFFKNMPLDVQKYSLREEKMGYTIPFFAKYVQKY